MKSAVLYIRVSTDEQAEKGYSQRAQEQSLRRYCDLQNIHIQKVIFEDHSAKSFERPQWIIYLAELRKRRHPSNLILFTKWDRFSRNAGDAYSMITTLRKLGVEPQAIEQPLDLEVPENKLMLAFYLAAPEVENDRRGLNTLIGMRRARKEGKYMAKAPYGYRNRSYENGSRYIAVYEPEAAIMRWVFETIAHGQFLTEHVFKQAQQKGLTCCKNNFWVAIKNPVYCGRIYVPPYKDESACYVKGQHEALISEDLFQDVQDILNGKRRVQRVRAESDDMLPLRGYLLCPSCGRNLTGSASTGRNGKHYYYHCTSTCGCRFKASDANEKFVEELRRYTPHPAIIALYKRVVSDVYKSGGTFKGEQRSLLTCIEEQNKKLAKARELLLKEAIDPTDFRLIKSGCEEQIQRLEFDLAGLKSNREDIDALLEKACKRLGELDTLYMSGTTIQRRQLIGSIFPEKLVFEKTGYRTARLNEVVQLIYAMGAAFSPNKKEKVGISADLYTEAPPVGLEPTTP